MLILIEWHKNISFQTEVACIVRHADPQIKCLISSRPKVEADVLYS